MTVLAQCRTCIDLRDVSDVLFDYYNRIHGHHNAWVVRRDLPEVQFIRWSDFYDEYNSNNNNC
jgi:hypothetical protein